MLVFSILRSPGGLEALSVLRSLEPDAMVADFVMLGWTVVGLKVLFRLRAVWAEKGRIDGLLEFVEVVRVCRECSWKAYEFNLYEMHESMTCSHRVLDASR
jgi:hypothetical protein